MTTRVCDIQGRRLMLTHLDRGVWPEAAITKDELLEYYTGVADHVLPFIANRPLSLQRVADPVTGECLYQKTAPAGLPTWIPTRRVRSEHAALGYADHVIGGDLPSLLHLLNLGHIAVHPWSCTVETIDRPDQLLFDLDPIEIAFREVRNAALLLRDLLRHVQDPGLGQDDRRARAPRHGAARPALQLRAGAHRRRDDHAPGALRGSRRLFTLDMRRARRRGKILIDVHRNHRGATLVGPYGAREYPGAPVATPIEWAELERPLYPEEFHVRNTRERLARVGDPLASFFHHPQSLEPLLESGRLRRARPMA